MASEGLQIRLECVDMTCDHSLSVTSGEGELTQLVKLGRGVWCKHSDLGKQRGRIKRFISEKTIGYISWKTLPP